MEYFVVFRDFGRAGLEAVVDPAHDRELVVQLIATKELTNIVRIDHIRDGLVHDVTNQLIDAAEAMREALYDA